MILYFVCEVIRWFFFKHLLFLFVVYHTGHMLSIPQSLFIISFFETPLNRTISLFIYFRAVLLGTRRLFSHCPINMLKMLSWKFLRPITLVLAPMFLVFIRLSMCLLAWYDKAAQPQNITFSQRKSWAESFLILIFYIARVI